MLTFYLSISGRCSKRPLHPALLLPLAKYLTAISIFNIRINILNCFSSISWIRIGRHPPLTILISLSTFLFYWAGNVIMSEIWHKALRYGAKELEWVTSFCPLSNLSSGAWLFSFAVLLLQVCFMVVMGSFLLFFCWCCDSYALASGGIYFFFFKTWRRPFSIIREFEFVSRVGNWETPWRNTCFVTNYSWCAVRLRPKR